MSIKTMGNKITNKLGRQILIAKKHSPVLMFGAGVIGFGATVILASRATMKVSEVLDKADEDNKKVDDELTDNGAISSDHPNGDEWLKRKFGVKMLAAIEVAKLYAPAFAVGAVSVACLTGSHVILTKRNVGLTAAYAAVDKGFREYRARVIQELGADKDTEFRLGMVEREIAVETDEGPVVKTVKAVDKNNGISMYATYFDEMNPRFSKRPNDNMFLIQSVQNYANDKLQARGHIFLNEVRDMLGFEPVPEGQIVGWILGEGDETVDFGVFRGDIVDGHSFVTGEMNHVLLDFNVCGNIYDKI